ncbi:MAG TPA: NTP transferase domain-containing protein, partial [Solirubrobacteraceae bacterium]|nr:NTP transferase domain-containing protein [Solirubrobacteraceae bacterium]
SVARVVVVVGSGAEAVRGAVAGAEVVECANWTEGQSASLRRGLDALSGSERVLVLLGDQPGVTAAAIDRIASQPPGSRASYGGRPGHPALLGPEQVEAARDVRGDEGLRGLTWTLVACDDVASGDDVDTPEDLARSRAGGR